MKNIPFSKLKIGSAFSPCEGFGQSRVYVKRENGICPQVGSKDGDGIFYPEDRVQEKKLPDNIMKHYR